MANQEFLKSVVNLVDNPDIDFSKVDTQLTAGGKTAYRFLFFKGLDYKYANFIADDQTELNEGSAKVVAQMISKAFDV